MIAALAALLLTACPGAGPPADPTPSTTNPTAAGPSEAPDPCPDTATVDLGRPVRTGAFAEFTLAGPDRVWVTATGFEKGGIFDPDVGSTAVYVGTMDQPPTYDEQRSAVSDTVVDTRVVEDTWTALDLEADRHWLWTSNSAVIALKTCDGPPVTDVYAVPAG